MRFLRAGLLWKSFIINHSVKREKNHESEFSWFFVHSIGVEWLKRVPQNVLCSHGRWGIPLEDLVWNRDTHRQYSAKQDI